MSSFDPAELEGGWDLTELPGNIRIGRDCWLEARASFDPFRSEREPGLVLGDRVRVYSWTRFSLEPSGYAEVGDDTLLVGAMLMGAGTIRLGRRVVISYGVTILDCDFHPLDPERRRLDAAAHAPFGDRPPRQPFDAEPVTVGDDVAIGAGAIVVKGVTIGPGAQVGAGAVVTRDVAAGEVVAGNPARPVEQP